MTNLRLAVTAILLVFTFLSNAQTYIDIPWRRGTVVVEGAEHSGIIRLGGDLNAPWLNHQKVFFVKDSDIVAGKRPKKKVITEYRADDLEGYKTFTVDENGIEIPMNFVSASIGISPGLGMKKKPKQVMLQHIDGKKIAHYKYIPMPAKKLGVSSNEERAEAGAEAIKKTSYYFLIDNEFLAVTDANLVDLFSDCENVVEKIKNEEYGFEPKESRKKQKGLGKFMSSQFGNTLDYRISVAINEYNQCL